MPAGSLQPYSPKKGHYIIALKENQPKLCWDVKDYFAKEMERVDEAEAEIEEAGYFEEQAEDEEQDFQCLQFGVGFVAVVGIRPDFVYSSFIV